MKAFANTIGTDERISARYPRRLATGDGRSITLTPLLPSDWELLQRFVHDTPEEERRYFRRDLSDPQRVQRWCSELDYHRSLPILAWENDRILADGVLLRDPGLWTAHLGTVRLLVHPDYRRLGLGSLMIGELYALAEELDLHKLVYECAEEQAGLRAFLRKVGFREAARLPDFIRDAQGEFHSMIVMVRSL